MNYIFQILVLLTVVASPSLAQDAADPGAPQEAIEHWRDLRFGMFVHWGPVSLTGHEIGWSRGRETPIEEYDNLYKRFDAPQFDPDAWAQTAADAGMKYLVLTTKHHDGFCLWPSQYTGYNISKTPLHRDVVKELAEACRRHGIEFGTYYSTCDWYHPDYPKGSPGGKTDKPDPDLDRYMQYVQNQTSELIENYGPLLTMWFDVPREVHQDKGLPVTLALRKLQPNIVINNRGYMESSGDYDTPEQRIGKSNRVRPWETCMTICKQWAWKPDDTLKSLDLCLRTLLTTIGGDGNLLFNVGPMPDGRIEPDQVQRLREMGQWIKPRAQAIYSTRGGPYMPGVWGASTCRGNDIYLFVMTWPDQGPLTMPPLGATIKSAELLHGPAVKMQQNDDGVTFDIPADQRDPIATVIHLAVDQAAFDIPQIHMNTSTSGSLAYEKPATASNVYQNLTPKYGPQAAIDDDTNTRWATDIPIKEATLEVDLGKPVTIAGALLMEPEPYQYVRKFQLEYLDGDTWHVFHEGTTIGPKLTLSFTPFTAQHVRLHTFDAVRGPTIVEFQLFSPPQTAP